MMTGPKWATRVRRAQLVRMGARYGNRCLQGHLSCHDLTHYIRVVEKVVTVAEPKVEQAVFRDGTPQPGVFYTVYRLQRVVVRQGMIPQAATDVTAGPIGVTRLADLFDLHMDGAIAHWVAEDKAQASAEWKAEQQRFHSDQKRIRQGPFDSIRREQFMAEQPRCYIVGLTPDLVTMRPTVLVRIASTDIYLFVDVGDVIQRGYRKPRRKAIRHGHILPRGTEEAVAALVQGAVDDWWAKRK